MTPLKPDPCAITLRWIGAGVPVAGEWLRSKRTGYLILSALVAKVSWGDKDGASSVGARDSSRVTTLRIKALRFAIDDIPADAVVHHFTWDPRGKKKAR